MTLDINRPTKRRNLIMAGIGALATVGLGAAMMLRPKKPPTFMDAGRVSGELPLQDLDHKAWKSADAVELKPLGQNIAYPRLGPGTLKAITARTLFNGTQLGVLLEWGDGNIDDLESIVTFRDAVAAMLPMNPQPGQTPIFMGFVGKPVYILQWKASWQRDVDQGFQDVEKSYPRWFNDVYPGHPAMEKLGMTAETARSFYPGLAAGNVLSQQKRTSPVEEMMAEGFGTLTSLPAQRAAGRGINTKGRWRVTLGTPAPGEGIPALQPGTSVPIAFAVWDGGGQQRGGRKHYIDWIQVNLPGS